MKNSQPKWFTIAKVNHFGLCQNDFFVKKYEKLWLFNKFMVFFLSLINKKESA